MPTYHTAYLLRLRNAAKASDYVKDMYEKVKRETADHWLEVAKILRSEV
jgi:hypothetical protein